MKMALAIILSKFVDRLKRVGRDDARGMNHSVDLSETRKYPFKYISHLRLVGHVRAEYQYLRPQIFKRPELSDLKAYFILLAMSSHTLSPHRSFWKRRPADQCQFGSYFPPQVFSQRKPHIP